MLPKIAVGVLDDRNAVLSALGVKEKNVMGYEGKEAKVSELRRWVYSSIGIARHSPKLTLVLWDADELSPESQAVLLKPMEELDDQVSLILTAKNENALLPTILSRGVVTYLGFTEEEADSYWSEIRKCWSSGPAACIAFSDGLAKEEMVLVMEEIIGKLHQGMKTEVNQKRLAILDLAITGYSELKNTNVNHKLVMDNFLLNSWRAIKA